MTEMYLIPNIPSRYAGFYFTMHCILIENKSRFRDCNLRFHYKQAALLACAVRLANTTHSLGAALRAFQRITLCDWQT